MRKIIIQASQELVYWSLFYAKYVLIDQLIIWSSNHCA
jgi:hypothetical protein